MDIQKIKDQLNQIEGYKSCLAWIIMETEKEEMAKAKTAVTPEVV